MLGLTTGHMVPHLQSFDSGVVMWLTFVILSLLSSGGFPEFCFVRLLDGLLIRSYPITYQSDLGVEM